MIDVGTKQLLSKSCLTMYVPAEGMSSRRHSLWGEEQVN